MRERGECEGCLVQEEAQAGAQDQPPVARAQRAQCVHAATAVGTHHARGEHDEGRDEASPAVVRKGCPLEARTAAELEHLHVDGGARAVGCKEGVGQQAPPDARHLGGLNDRHAHDSARRHARLWPAH